MILRHLQEFVPPSATGNAGPQPASELFMSSQKNVPPPFGLVLQIAHSELAGELVKALLPESFGDLPPEVAEAAWKHDAGWQPSDAAQTGRMPASSPKPFPEVPEDELPAWRGSLALAESCPPLTRVLMGRHFAALANQPAERHDVFCREDAKALAEYERTLGLDEADVKRWTAAVGFCDLMSLVLSSGVAVPASFPLGVHPAIPEAADARTVTLTWKDGQPGFSEPIFKPGTTVRIEGQRFDPGTGDVAPMALQWTLR